VRTVRGERRRTVCMRTVTGRRSRAVEMRTISGRSDVGGKWGVLRMRRLRGVWAKSVRWRTHRKVGMIWMRNVPRKGSVLGM
jgi:hypothetical protein